MKSRIRLRRGFFWTNPEDKELRATLENLLGLKPRRLAHYINAISHSSVTNEPGWNNERLEYLGDAILGAIVGEYLFKKYPLRDEGFLTEMRAKIVCRASLNDIARKMGLEGVIRYNKQDRSLRRSHIFGNALEALIGAVYLDLGFERTRRFVLKRILSNHVDIDNLENVEFNYKNKIYSFAQKQNKDIDFVTVEEKTQAGRKVFTVAIMIDGKELVRATGYTKKDAGQNAAEAAVAQLQNYN